MFMRIFDPHTAQPPVPKEGDLYKKVTVSGKVFELYYGYYEEFERDSIDPMPIYPDFIRNPEYGEDGTPIVTGMQDPCKHYYGKSGGDSCVDCAYFKSSEELFGLCTCQKNKKETSEATD